MEMLKIVMYLLCGLFVVESNQDRKDTKMALLDEKKLPLVALFDMTDVNDNIQSYVDDAMNNSLIKILEEKTKEAVAAEIKLVQNCSMMIQQIVPSAQDIDDAKREFHFLSDQIGNLRRKLSTWIGQPSLIHTRMTAFTAILSRSVSLGEEEIIRYDNVLTNIGNAYHSATGIFTVTTSGLYSLSASMMGDPSNHIHLLLVLNNNELVRLYTAGKRGRHEISSQTINVLLSKNDKVWVQHMKGSGSNIYGAERFNVFSGVLLYETE